MTEGGVGGEEEEEDDEGEEGEGAEEKGVGGQTKAFFPQMKETQDDEGSGK